MDELTRLNVQLDAAKSSLQAAIKAADREAAGTVRYVNAKRRAAAWRVEVARLEALIEAKSQP